jgi:nucleoside-diphosphate-sugar epimerase
MRIALIGATGVLGRAVIPRLLAKHHQLLAISPHPEKATALYGNTIEAAEGDLLASDAEARFTALLSGYDTVLNLATSIPKQSDAGKAGAWDKNNQLRQEGSPRLVRAILAAGVKTYIQQSITMAYPDMGEAWIGEDTEVKSPAVAAMEAAVRAIPSDALNWTILRGAIFVGKDTFQDDTIRALKAGEIKIACDGQAYQSYIHVEDMAEAVILATEKHLAGAIFNICAEPMREGDYLRALAKAIGAAEPANNPDAVCPTSQRCSNQAAKEILGWEPKWNVIPLIAG